MTKVLIRSLLVLGAGAVIGCTPTTSPEVSGIAGSGPIDVTGAAGNGMCGNNFGMTFPGGTGVATGFGGGFGAPTTPQFGPMVQAAEAPPAISGGTLRITADGTTAIAADPDRDQVYIVDLTKRAVTFTVALQHGDEPGRVALDASGRAHVALRRGGALVTIAPTTGAILFRRAVCAAPRGVAYEAATDLLHVACADGQLVSLPAAGGAATRTLQLDSDLRDVIAEGGRLHVTRFRSSELLTLDDQGRIASRVAPQPFRSISTRGGELYTPSTVWRAMELPSGGVAMLHQRGLMDEVMPSPGGYGGFSPCDAIVQTAVTTVAPGAAPMTGPAMAGLAVPVDMAISADGNRVAIVSAGNATNRESMDAPARMPRVFVTDMSAATDQVVGCQNDGQHGPCLPVGTVFAAPTPPPIDTPPAVDTGAAGTSGADPTGFAGTSGSAGAGMMLTQTGVSTTCDPTGMAPQDNGGAPEVVGQPIAVAFAGQSTIVVQSREPAVLSVSGGAPITLSTVSRADTGHTIFHANAGAGIACASCHAEGTEDGRTWAFACEGVRRTQSLQVGLKGTEPFHWGGDEKDFPTLVSDVFQGRMSGPQLGNDQVNATLNWIDAQPRRTRTPPTDTAAVARGKTIFNDTTRAGCATCHNGPSLTNNQTVDVGTGGMFQVPSLVGIGTRGPFMHNGCAATLRDRFGPCGGGDRHGVTSTLKPAELDDLLAYMNTL
jgi:hypothetical protein